MFNGGMDSLIPRHRPTHNLEQKKELFNPDGTFSDHQHIIHEQPKPVIVCSH